MTVAELEERLSVEEFFEWSEWFRLKDEARKKAEREAERRYRRRR